MASFICLVRPKISLSRLSSMLPSSGHSLPIPKPASLRLISRSFCTITLKAGFEDSSHLHPRPRYAYSHDIPTLVEEIDSLRNLMRIVLLKGGAVTAETVLASYPEELLKQIDDIVGWNLFVKQGCRAQGNRSEDEKNFYVRLEIPGVDWAGLHYRVDDVCYMDFVVYKKKVNFIAVEDRQVDPEFGDLDVGREYRFHDDFPADIDPNNSRYFVNKGVSWVVLPKSMR